METSPVPRGGDSSRSCIFQREEIFHEDVSFKDTTTCGRLILSKYIRTQVSTKVTITFSPSLTCWANMRGPYRSRVKVEARWSTLSPR